MIRQFVSAVLVLCFSTAIFAQIKTEKPVKVCSLETARLLVTGEIENSKTLEDKTKRVKLLIRAADFLWKMDEAKSRQYLSDALELARDDAREKFEAAKGKKKEFRRFSFDEQDLRFQVIAAIAKRDSVWAKKASETVLADLETERKEKESQKSENNQTNALLDIASDLMKTDKAQSVNFARRAMQFPLDDQNASRWLYFFYNAAEVDQTVSDQLFAEFLQLRGEDFAGYLFFDSAYPFGSERPFGVSTFSLTANVPKNFRPNADLQRQFVNLLIVRSERIAANPIQVDENNDNSNLRRLPENAYLSSMMASLSQTVNANFPELSERFNAAQNLITATLNEKSSNEMERLKNQKDVFAMSFDEQIEKFEKDESKVTDFEIVNLIITANRERDFVRAETWLAKIKEEKPRDATTNYFYFSRAKKAVKDKRFDDAEKFAAKVPELEHRAIIYFELAEAKLKLINDKTQAAEVLNKVYDAAIKSPNTVERAQVLLGVSYWFAKYDQIRAIEVLSEVVKTANRLENADLTVEQVVRKIEGKDYGSFVSLATPGYNLETSFSSVSLKDFNGANAYARNFDDKYWRTLAVIATVKDCKDDAPKKPKAKK